jgi:hypothetical protein
MTDMGRFFHRPRKSLENVVGGGALISAIIVLAVSFAAPKARVVSVTGFHQTGTFSYSAKAVHSSTTYPDGMASSGQPIYLSLIRELTVAFSYRFESRLAHGVRGTVTMKALLASSGSWQHLYTLERAKAFSGDATRVAGTFDLRQLQAVTNQISVDAGTSGANYTIQLEPVVHLTGEVGGQPIRSTFAPVLPFTLSPQVLSLSIPQTAAPPGATYAAPTAAQTLATGLHPIQPGTVSGLAPNHLSVLRYHFAVSSGRGAGLALLGVALVAFLGKLIKPRREVWSHEKRVAARYAVPIIDVGAATDNGANSRTTVVPDFESLAKLAQYCERPILRETCEQHPAYTVEEEGRLYVHRPMAPLASPAGLTPAAEAS